MRRLSILYPTPGLGNREVVPSHIGCQRCSLGPYSSNNMGKSASLSSGITDLTRSQLVAFWEGGY